MKTSRVLLVEADERRAERLATVFEFLDAHPQIVASIDEVERKDPSQWLAIVVGAVDAAEFRGFCGRLQSSGHMPPLLLLPEHHTDGAHKFGLSETQCWALQKPLKQSQVSELLNRAAGLQTQQKRAAACTGSSGPTGSSPATLGLRRQIEQVAGFDTTVLILGESGTGKEVVARAIHDASPRRNGPFVAVNCGAIPSDLLESELFGHEKGAFTGALTARKGRFEIARGGTLLLDEIGDMSLPMQVKLLRVLQERCFERVGSNQSIPCDVRIIAATHRNLEQRVDEGSFRIDLFYRLNVFPIDMPPLRERVGDLSVLAEAISAQLLESGRGGVSFSPDAMAVLQGYAWPGNVRELANLIERLAVTHMGACVGAMDLPLRYRAHAGALAAPPMAVPAPVLLPAAVGMDLPAAMPMAAAAVAMNAAVGMEEQRVMRQTGTYALDELPPEGLDLREHLARIELKLIRAALQRSEGVVAHAAQKYLGLRRTTLAEKLSKYGLDRECV